MAVPKVCGIETEFGIQHLGGDGNPVASSSLLVNAYVGGLARAGWDFEDEQPGNDARGFAREGALPPEVETHLVNAVLTNGARYYVDHAHPEYSTPECPDALELVRYDRAGEEILRRSMRAAAQVLPPGQRIVVYKNNSDGKGNSYGCHENYLMDRAVPFSRIARQVMAHFVTRQVFCGAGKVGTETPQAGADVPYQLSQRRILRGRSRPGDHLEAADREHAGRAPRRSPALPAAARDRGRRQPLRGGHLLEGGDDGLRAGHDRGRGAGQPGAGPGEPGPGDPAGGRRP